MRKLLRIVSLIFVLFALGACKDTPPVDDVLQNEAIIENIAYKVIFASYVDLDNKAVLLKQSIEAFAIVTTEEKLESCKVAWRAARVPWEQSEGFLFGPVDNAGIDPSIDSWPVNKIDLENVLKSGAKLTKTYVDGLEGTLKGFHTIEYLLWGTGDKLVTQFTPREFEYLIAVAESFHGATTQLKDEWSSTGKNFISELTSAGAGSKLYPSSKSVYEELAEGLSVIADEVANGKIQDPLSLQDLKLEESQFSANSKADFANNIRSIQNVYLGIFGSSGSGLGLSLVVAANNKAIDERFRIEIVEAINAIETIEGTFSKAIFTNKASVENAQSKVRTLLQTLEADIKPIINKL